MNANQKVAKYNRRKTTVVNGNGKFILFRLRLHTFSIASSYQIPLKGPNSLQNQVYTTNNKQKANLKTILVFIHHYGKSTRKNKQHPL